MQENLNTPPKNLKYEEAQSQMKLQSQLKHNQINFPISVDSFEELTECLFFDKTKFIKVFIQKKGSFATQINRPRRWGKTLSLKMIQTFFQPHIDDIREFTDKETFIYDFKNGKRNWKYFQNSYISKDKEFVEEYFGKHPVLYVDFKNVGGDNDKMILNSLKMRIRNVYEQHFYVFERLENIRSKTESMTAQSKMNIFFKYYDKQEDDLRESLFFLSEQLHQYFQKKVIVLIDEYDSPIIQLMNEGLQGKENQTLRQWTSKKISEILKSLIKTNDNVMKVLLTGIFDTIGEGGSGVNNVNVLSLVSKPQDELQLMIGLTQQEIETLIQEKILKLDENREDKVREFLKRIKEWYNGYQFGDSISPISLYSPFSVEHYLEDVVKNQQNEFVPLPKSYWTKSGSSDVLEILTKLKVSESFQLQLLDFILGNDKLKKTKDFHFPNMIGFSSSSIQQCQAVVLGILEQGGYLRVSNQSSAYEYVNKEVEFYFKERLIQFVSDRVSFDTNSLSTSLTDEFINFEKEEFRKFLQENILNKFPKSQQKVENEFYFQAFFTCLSIYSYINGWTVSVNAAPEYITEFNKKIDNVFFPTQEKGQRKLVIHEYKCTFSISKVQSLLEKAIWQVYAKCYMSGFTESKDWDLIVVRAIVFYQDKQYNWHLRMEEYQHLNQIAKVLMENFYSQKGKLLRNCEDLVEGKNQSREQFLERYGCRNFNEFIKYFDYLQQDFKQVNQSQLIEEDESIQMEFSQMKIQEENQSLLERVGKQQLQQIEELIRRKEEYLNNKIQVEHQVQQSQNQKNKPTNVRQKVEDDRIKKRKLEHEVAFNQNRKRKNEEEYEQEEIQEEAAEEDGKKQQLGQMQEQESNSKQGD